MSLPLLIAKRRFERFFLVKRTFERFLTISAGGGTHTLAIYIIFVVKELLFSISIIFSFLELKHLKDYY